jgi:hypothetical protein
MAAAGVPQSVSRDKDQGITPERGIGRGPPLAEKQRFGGSQKSLPAEGSYSPTPQTQEAHCDPAKQSNEIKNDVAAKR